MSNTAQTKTDIQLPLVHLNGTRASDLIDANLKAANAIREAISAIQRAYPNARDYYPLGNDASARAMREHESRIARLNEVRAELMAIVEHVDETGRR
jgi:hypothetical protein